MVTLRDPGAGGVPPFDGQILPGIVVVSSDRECDPANFLHWLLIGGRLTSPHLNQEEPGIPVRSR